jgi:thymidylate synthase (FAD)
VLDHFDGQEAMETRRATIPAAEEILGGYFPVLDHGFVSLIDYMGGDAAIEQAARVSYGYGTRTQSHTRGLIRYLRRHLHTTPSEMVELKFHCAMPNFVARQWIRHRTASVNEYSGRYSLMPLLFYRPQYEQFALQTESNRQGRETTSTEREVYDRAVGWWEETRERSSDTYGWLVENDVARELARIDLPLSTYTQWYWKIDLHNLMHFLTLRVDSHAQWEIRRYGEVMAGMLKRLAPLSYEAWIDYQVCGTRVGRSELEILRGLVDVAEGGNGLRARGGAAIDSEAMKKLGLSGREIRELIEKLGADERVDFELDIGRMLPAEVFESRMREAVPGEYD